MRVAGPEDRDRAVEYLRARKQEIIAELARKSGVDRHEVQVMLPS